MKKALYAMTALVVAAGLFAPTVVAGEGEAVKASQQEAGPVGVSGQEAESARKEIKAAYDRILAAMARKDLQGVFGEYADDTVFTDAAGRRTSKAEEEKFAAEAFEMVESIRAWNDVQFFTLRGDRAHTILSTSVKVVLPESKNEKRSMVDATEISMDSWVKRDGKWLLYGSRIICVKDTPIFGKFLPKR